MFYIVSTGRSGTQTMSRVLSLVDGCVCLHEPAPELILESSGFRYGTVTRDTIREILLSTRAPRVNGSVYCESNQTLSLIIPVLIEAFPEARYIWLLRNGLDVVASAYQKQWYTGRLDNRSSYEECSAIEKQWIDGRIEGDRCGDMSPAEWQALDRFERCCWYWSYVNKVIEADLQTYAPDRFILLRLEEIAREFPNILRWMGLKAAILPSIQRHNAAKREPYHWTNWTSEERAAFERWCGPMMDRYYPAWRTPEGRWNGIEYTQDTEDWLWLRSRYRLVKTINRLLARNTALEDHSTHRLGTLER